MEERFAKVAYLALRDGNGNFTVKLPVYVNLKDVDRQAVDKSREEIMSRVSSIISNHYERQIADFIANKKKEALNARKK